MHSKYILKPIHHTTPVKILRVLLVQNCIVSQKCVEKKDLVNCLVQHLVLERTRLVVSAYLALDSSVGVCFLSV